VKYVLVCAMISGKVANQPAGLLYATTLPSHQTPAILNGLVCGWRLERGGGGASDNDDSRCATRSPCYSFGAAVCAIISKYSCCNT
jgi:hypothetical protein